ncbi:MAG: DUF4838 domain-containing protein, partial [Planctomycetes bacterium]|nr:DUF4838 domain-containing protein [Planctomycetota bacterium]
FADKLKALDADAYIVHVAPTFAVLAGSPYAEWDFVRMHLGAESYVPNELFTVIPKHEKVLVPVGTRVEEPVFLSRGFSALNSSQWLRGHPPIPWRIVSGHGRYKFHHNIHSFIPVEKFGKDHPEFFPMVGDKRSLTSDSAGPGPCISNPEVVKIVIHKCREFFDKNPKELCISLGMTDGGYCECPACKAMDGPSLEINGRTSPKSNRYYAFLNKVAKAIRESHPGRFIGTLGYAGADLPPSFPVERNLIVYMCYNRANWVNAEDKKADLAMIDAWMERLDRIGIYEYLYGLGYSVPRLYTHRLADMLRYVGNKKPLSGFYAEIYSHHGLDGPKAWLTERLLWNPNQDVDRLLAQWCSACFGPAAEPMRQYFDLLENTWIKNSSRVKQTGKFWGLYRDEQLEMFLPDDMHALWKLLDTAKAKADSQVVGQRIDYFASTLKITDVTVKQYHAYNNTMALIKDKAEPGRVLKALLWGDALAPDFDLAAYTGKLIAADPTKFIQGVQVARGALATQYIFDRAIWPAVHARLKAGERDPAKLTAEAKEALRKIVGGASLPRVEKMVALSERIAVAKRVSKPPTIDGTPDEPCWQWVDHRPWFARLSMAAHTGATQFALAYDDEQLYIALRCPGQDPCAFSESTRKASSAYDCPAWKYPSVEVFLNPDERDAPASAVPYYQVIAAAAGGAWETPQKALASWKVTDNGKDLWQAELVLSWKKLGIVPKRFPWLRLNLVRNMKFQGDQDAAGWFVTALANNSPSARGWLLFEP